MSRNFNDLLSRADELNSSVRFDTFKQLSKPDNSFSNASVPKQANEFKLSQFQDIFKSSEEIWKKKRLQDNEPTNGQSLLGLSQVFKKPEPSRLETTTGGIPKNYDINSLQAIEGFVEDSIERTRLESERLFLNQHVLEMDQIIAARRTASLQLQETKVGNSKILTKYALPLDSHIENTFAKKMELAVTSGGFKKVLDELKNAVNEINDASVSAIWETVFALCKTTLMTEGGSVAQFRNSKAWMRHVVENGSEHLQFVHRRYMESIIEANLEQAQRGGIPGTLPLIEAFLNVANYNYGRFMDDVYGSHPIWCVLFQTLRLGDYKAAATVAGELAKIPSVSILVLVLNNLAENHLMDHSTRIKLYAEWNHEERTCTDAYKHAVYGLLLDFESEGVVNSIEDWLWAKLVSIKLDQQHGLDRFQNLQRAVSLEYGESYFMDDANGGSSAVYFTALFLTGQLERAIEVLQTSDMTVFSTHIVILCYCLKMIVLTDNVRDDVLVVDPGNVTECKINFSKIVILYVKKFELVNISYALTYCFFLNKLQLDHKGSNTGNLFEACVSRIVYVTGEREAILGKLQSDGSRTPGLLDKMANEINVPNVIARVALDTSLNGDNIGACFIYCIAGRPNEAVKLLNRQLCSCIPSVSHLAESAVTLGEKLAKRYGNGSDPTVEKQHVATLKSLIQCYCLFRLSKEERFAEVVAEAERLNVIPLDPDVVPTEVESFKMLAEEVRTLLPELCLSLMGAVVQTFKSAASKGQTQIRMKTYAKAILLYSAMVPQRFPTSITSKLLQLQTQVS